MIPFKVMPADNLEKFTKSIAVIAFTQFRVHSLLHGALGIQWRALRIFVLDFIKNSF